MVVSLGTEIKIYKIVNPNSKRVVFVGFTSKNLRRMRRWLRDSVTESDRPQLQELRLYIMQNPDVKFKTIQNVIRTPETREIVVGLQRRFQSMYRYDVPNHTPILDAE